MDEEQEVIDQLIDYIDKAILKNSVSNRHVAAVLAFLNEKLRDQDGKFIRKDIPNSAKAVISFLKGLISEDLIQANGGVSTNTLTADTVTSQLLNILNEITAKDATFSGDVTVSEKDVTVSKGNINISKGNATVAGKTTTLNLLVQALADTYNLNVSHVATLMGTIVKDYVSSESFVSGFAGEGMKIYKALNGDWNMEIDNLTVRKIFSVFELVVQKITHQGGMVIRSAAGGKLTKIVDGGSYWKCEHDSTDDFVQNDQIICQSFTGTKIKRYWRLITSAGAGYFNLSKSDCETGSATPEVGDDVAVLGNRTNTARQKAQIDCAIGNTAPYRDDYDRINSYSLVGKLITRTGNLSGITDAVFGVLSGSGLYATNVYLKGIFILRSGKSVESELNAVNDIAIAAQGTADNAQSTANAAKTNAQTANSLLTDIASDSKLTATEKQQTKKEWDIIVSEKPLNNASAAKFGVATTSYDAAYNTLNTYITPLLASLSTTSNIVGATFRSTFKSYYDARTNLLNAISAKAKELADAAQDKANTAQNNLDNLKIGGRNLLENSSVERKGSNEYLHYANTTSCFDKNGPGLYTISFDLKVTKEGDVNAYSNPGTPDTFKYLFSPSLTIKATTEYKRYSMTVNVRLSNPDVTWSSLSFYGTYGTDIIPTVKNVKIELGNKATDWTPAPEDVDKRITTVETNFEIREGQISSKVSEATTAATNAKKSETDASTYATTAGQKATAAGTSATSASGSASTASAKAGEASTSANNAKKSADDAAAKLVTITEKESKINQTAGSITLQVTEVTKKVSEATTAATIAKKSETDASTSATTARYTATAAGTSATSASGSASTASAKAGEAATSATNATTKANAAASSATAAAGSATNAKTSADSAAVILQTVTTKQSEINAKADQITLKVTEVTTKTAQATNAAELAMAMSKGKMLYRDPSFTNSHNGIGVYNNSGGTGVSINRVSGVAGNPNGSGYCLKITTTGTASPGFGGFAQPPAVRANQCLIYRFIANIPVGRRLGFARNSAGSGVIEGWLTSNIGTGKWEEYVYKLKCGSSGSFSTCGHFYLVDGTAPIASSPLIWYVCYATVFDITDAEVDYIADAANKYTTKTTYAAGIKVLSDSITSKVSQSDFNSLGTRVSSAESTISQHTTQISSKVAQATFDSLGNRVSTAESAILQQAGLIEQRVTKTDYNKIGRLLAVGHNTDSGGTSYVMLNETRVNKGGRGFTLCKILKSSLALSYVGAYDVYAGGSNYTNFVNALNAIDANSIIVVISDDAISIDTATANVLANYGGSGMTCTSSRRSYVLIGQKGIGKGNGLEQWKQSSSGGVAISANIINGIVTGFWGGGNLVSKIESAETRITQTEKSIALKANQTTVDGINTRLQFAEAKITPDAIKLTVKSQTETIAANAAKRTEVVVDATGLDQTKYYPVTISLYTGIPTYTITLSRTLTSSYGKPTWSTHTNGFSVLCKWSTNAYGWGTIGIQRTILDHAYSHASVVPVGNIGQMNNSSNEYIYVRGGSKYKVEVEGGVGVAIILRTSAFTISSQTIDLRTEVSPPVVDLKDRPTTDTIKSQILLDGFGISVFGKKIDFTGKVTFSSMDSATQSTINGKATPAQIATAKNEAISAAAIDATTKANNAKSGAISSAATDAQTKANSALVSAKNYTDTLKNSLGTLAYESMVTKAKLDSTIIEGGFIKTSLIDVETLIAKNLAATKGTIGGFKITATSIGASSNGDKLVLAPDGLILESTQQYVSIGKAVPGSSGVSDLVAAYFSTKVPTGTGPTNGAGTVMINTSGGLTQVGLSIRTGNRSTDYAIDLTGRIKVNGSIGLTGDVSIAHCWLNGAARTGVLQFKDGILYSIYYP